MNERSPAPPRDPRDGAQPPAVPTDSPANPVALAALISGNPVVSDAQVTAILGAPLAVLLQDKRSILYAGSAKVAAKAAGAVARPGEVVQVVSAAATTPKAAPAFDVRPYLRQLEARGVTCAEWSRHSAAERRDAALRLFYPSQRSATLPLLSPPGQPVKSTEPAIGVDELVAAIDAACHTALPAAAKTPPTGKPAVQWFLTQLEHGGVGCVEWARMSGIARLNTVRDFFYPATTVSVAPATQEDARLAALKAAARAAAAKPSQPQPPERPSDLVDAIDAACNVAHESAVAAPGTVSSASVDLDAWADATWQRFAALGITCDQWFASDSDARWQMIWALHRQQLIAMPTVSLTWGDIFNALDRGCVRRAEPATRNPTDSIRARVRALLDCAALDAQDKLQQIEVILRAFPEYNGDRRALYRLALARYDGCHPPPETGWSGQDFTRQFRAGTYARTLASGAEWIQESQQWGDRDVLDGDTRGMSLAQWVRQGPFMPTTGPDVFDPVQGATGDCYLVAAMASVAWARPDVLAQLSQPAPNGRRRFRLAGQQVEVSERTPCMILAGFAPIFARGSRPDAQWPGVLEKAFAARALGDTTDRPSIIAGVDNMFAPGDIIATARGVLGGVRRSFDAIPAMTGGSLFWHLTYFRSDDEVFDLLATYCTPDGRARVPMVAGTYPAGGFVDRTGLVANHAYSVLGFGFSGDRKFVVLRNPWGSSSMGLPTSGFTVPVTGRWLNRLNLNHGDGGVFALAHGAFAAGFSAFYGAQ